MHIGIRGVVSTILLLSMEDFMHKLRIWIQCSRREMTALQSVKSGPFDSDWTVMINNSKINKKRYKADRTAEIILQSLFDCRESRYINYTNDHIIRKYPICDGLSCI
jgi:hypothetical protein